MQQKPNPATVYVHRAQRRKGNNLTPFDDSRLLA